MRFLRDRGARVVLGSHGSATSAAAAEVAAETGMLLWETGAVGGSTVPAKPGRSFFRLAPMGANLGRNAIAFIRDQLVPKLQVVYMVSSGCAAEDLTSKSCNKYTFRIEPVGKSVRLNGGLF